MHESKPCRFVGFWHMEGWQHLEEKGTGEESWKPVCGFEKKFEEAKGTTGRKPYEDDDGNLHSDTPHRSHKKCTTSNDSLGFLDDPSSAQTLI